MRSAPTVDIHAHYFPEAYLRAVEAEGPRFGVRLDRSNREGPAFQMGPALGGPLRSAFCLDLGYDRPVEVVTRLTGPSRADRQRILGGNAVKLRGGQV